MADMHDKETRIGTHKEYDKIDEKPVADVKTN
jgi:hypothetical protein